MPIRCEDNAEYLRAYREKKAALGLCMCCLQPRVVGTTLCEVHLEKVRVSSRLRKARLRKEKKCRVCGGKPETRRSLCEFCRAKHNGAATVRRNVLLSEGMCPNCRKRRLKKGRARCRVCLVRNASGQQKRVTRAKLVKSRRGELLRLYDKDPVGVLERLTMLMQGRPPSEAQTANVSGN